MIQLREALTSPDPRVRAETIARTGRVAGVEPLLIGALQDAEPAVRRAAVRALARRQGPATARALIRTASADPASPVRLEAVAAIGRLLQRRLRLEGSPPAQ
jgi:HEAT repeat protein